MRNTRLPVSLNDTTCTTTDTASSTNSPPMMARAISCLVATATEPIRPPNASEPVSPMKIEADGEAVEPVGQVHGVAGADDDESGEHRKEPAEIDDHVLEHRKHQRGGERRAPQTRDRDASGERDGGLDGKSEDTGKAAGGLPRH